MEKEYVEWRKKESDSSQQKEIDADEHCESLECIGAESEFLQWYKDQSDNYHSSGR